MNKLFIKLFLGLLTVVVSAGFFVVTAKAQTAESISSYSTDITINTDSSLNVIETISYDFGSLERHGIFRNIPYKYKARGGTYKLRLSDFAVKDETGADIPFENSKAGGDVVLKIGDPDQTVTGAHIYKIYYTVKRAINYFDDHDELYWNAVGTGWSVPIAKGEAIVRAPAAVTQMTCYTGIEGSTEKNCSIIGGNTQIVNFTTSKPLEAGEGLTVVAGFPAGTISKPTIAQKLWDIFTDNGILLLPILVLGIMLYLWNKYGKDAKRKNSIVAQYEAPDKMSALYVGTLLHNGTKNNDIAAEIIYLAAHGFLNIKRIETQKMWLFKGVDYEFTKLDKSTSELSEQTRLLLEKLFGGSQTAKLSELKTDRIFGAALMKIKADTLKELVKDGYYKANPNTVKALWLGLAIVATVGLSVVLGNLIGYLGVIAVILSGLIVAGFAFIMPARTQKGADTVAHIKGLEEYLTVAEKDRLNFHNAPPKTIQQSPQHFELLLPFAIALGVEAAWAAQFKDLTNAPSWYNDSSGSAFNSVMFANSMNHFSESVESTARAVTTSSSGGSGFSGGGSGGGGGGGGGGSW
jgi:uncharacterized membrane protein YgcG